MRVMRQKQEKRGKVEEEEVGGWRRKMLNEEAGEGRREGGDKGREWRDNKWD